MSVTGVTVYKLSLKSDPKTYRYVGQALYKNKRLNQHIKEAKNYKGINPEKEKWIRDAINNGDEIISTTHSITPINTWSDAENEAIDELRKAGHDLFNKIGGKIVGFFEHDFVHEPEPLPTVEEFLELEWKQTYTQKKKNEWSALFHETKLTRTHWRVCVIKNSSWERVAAVNGHGEEGDQINLAVAVIEKMVIEAQVACDQVQQAQRLRPKFHE